MSDTKRQISEWAREYIRDSERRIAENNAPVRSHEPRTAEGGRISAPVSKTRKPGAGQYREG